MDDTEFRPGSGTGPPPPVAAAPQPGADRFAGPQPVTAAPAWPAFPGTDGVDPAAVFRGPGYQSPLPPTNGVATTALWLTLVGVFLPPVLLVSAVLGGIGLARAPRLHRAGARAGGGALAVSLVLLLLWGLAYLLLQTS